MEQDEQVNNEYLKKNHLIVNNCNDLKIKALLVIILNGELNYLINTDCLVASVQLITTYCVGLCVLYNLNISIKIATYFKNAINDSYARLCVFMVNFFYEWVPISENIIKQFWYSLSVMEKNMTNIIFLVWITF